MESQENYEANDRRNVVASLLNRMVSEVERRVGNAQRFTMAATASTATMVEASTLTEDTPVASNLLESSRKVMWSKAKIHQHARH